MLSLSILIEGIGQVELESLIDGPVPYLLSLRSRSLLYSSVIILVTIEYAQGDVLMIGGGCYLSDVLMI